MPLYKYEISQVEKKEGVCRVKEIEKKALSGTCQNERLIYGKIVEKTNSIEQTKAAILTLYLEDTLCKKE